MSKKRTDNTMGKLLTARRDTWACVVYPRIDVDDDYLTSSLALADYYLNNTNDDDFLSYVDKRSNVGALEGKAYDTFISRIKAAGGDNIAFMMHNKDVHNVDGKYLYKKTHIHVIKRFEKAVSAKYAAEWLRRSVGDCITDTDYKAFRPVEDLRAALDYLYHKGAPLDDYDDNGKYGYCPDDVGMIGRVLPIGYADFMALVFECGGFVELSQRCRESEEMARMLVKHCYFARSFYSAAKEGD